MADVNAILNRLLSSLTIADPTWDTSVGSATYKILESVATELAVTANNSTLQSYGYAAIGKAGTELDAFVNLWGMTRQLGTRSVGTVVISLASVSTVNINIPLGTQIYVPSSVSSSGANIYFSTTAPAVIAAGSLEVQIPVISTLTGSVNNVGIGQISAIATPLLGYPSVTNYAAMIGGSDTETDTQLQTRWSSTAFNNISGTTDKFISAVSQNSNINAVNVVGSQTNYNEQIQIITTISGGGSTTTSGFQLGFNTQAQLLVTSGSTLASYYSGSFPTNMTITSGFVYQSISGIFPPASGISVYYDGLNYNLVTTYSGWTGPTVNGSIYINFYQYDNTVLSGSSTVSGVAGSLNNLLNSGLSIPGTTIALVSGNSSFGTTLSSGIVISGTQLSATISGAVVIAGSGTNQVIITTSGFTTFASAGAGSYAGITISGQGIPYNWNNIGGVVSGSANTWQIIMSGIPFVSTTSGITTLTSSGLSPTTLAISGSNPGSFIVSGTSSPQVFQGVTVNFNQGIGYNIIVSGGTALATSTNSITSECPDPKYIYPEGQEQVGVNLGSYNQLLLQNNFDYNYPTSTNPPLKISLNPSVNNAPYTYTGNYLQLISEYIPVSSRIVNPTVNSNYIDVFVGSTTSTNVTEQVFFNPNITFNGISGQNYYAGNFIFSNGQSCLSGINAVVQPGSATGGDWYIPFTSRPVNNFPNQLVSGNLPSYINIGNYYVPVALKYVQYSNNGAPPTVSGLYGTSGTNVLYTTQSISNICVGLVATSGCPLVASGYIPFGTYITNLVPGIPNQIQLNSVLTSGILQTNTTSATWVTMAYPVYDITNNAGSILDATGIGIDSTNFANYGFPFSPPTPTVASTNHYYNSDISQTNDLIQQSRVIGTDVLVRQANYLNLVFCLSLVYQNSININTVNINIENTIAQYLSQLYFHSTLSLSNLISAILQVNGVSSARITTATENPNNYGVQSVAIDGTVLAVYTQNITLANNQLAQLYGINTIGYGSSNF